MKLFIAGTLILLSGPLQAAETIDQVLHTSAADWSRGDLRAFMQSYEDAPGTVFITRSGPIQGADRIRAYYAAHYGPASHATMGQLTLSVLEERPLAPNYALVTGRFQLNRPATEGGNATGIFTLLFHNTKQGWRIAYDHTS